MRKQYKGERKTVPHRLIDLSDAGMDARIERYVGTYKWLCRGENRFKFTAADGHMASGLFDAFDEGVTDYAEYIAREKLREKDFALGVRVNADNGQKRTLKLSRGVRAQRQKIRGLRRFPWIKN